MNESRVFAKENRQSIIGITKSIHEMDSKFTKIKHELEQKITENRRFIEVFARLNLVLDEIKMLVKDAKYHLLNLQAKIDSLAAGKISIRTINPLRLRKLLLDIQVAAPKSLSLICDPRKDLWVYYRYLRGTTYFWNGKIIVLSIPMIRRDQICEVYKVKSVPVPPPVPINGSQKLSLLAKYKLEANGFLVDKARKNYLLLTYNQIETCSQVNFQFCNVQSAIYPVGLSQLCIINLFMNIDNDISSFCTTEVVKTLLPTTQSLFGTSWLILAETRLIFSLVCAADIQELRSDPPFSIIDIPPGCAASNKYFTINTPFVVGRSNISERRSSDLINANFSDTAVWKPFREKFPNDTVIHLPPTLSEIDNMPLNSLLRELQMAKVDDSDPKWLWSLWSYVSLSLALVVVIIIILCCCKYKYARERAWLPE